MDTNNRNTSLVIAGVVLVVVLIAGWWLFTGKDDADSTSGTSTTSGQNNTGGSNTATGTSGTSTGTGSNTATTTPASGETLAVNDQPAGASVALSAINVTASSWVAVRDDRSILGASRFEPGVSSGTVRLIRGTTAGGTYQVVIYRDNGDKAFDFKSDSLVTGVSDSFTATAVEGN